MSSKATISHSLGMSDMVMDKYLADVEPQAFMARPVKGMNHLAWQIGHLISSEHKAVEQVKPGASPTLPDGFLEKYAMDKHASDNAADFHSKDELLGLWKTQRAATKQVLDGLSDDELDAPCPNEKMRGMCPTVGSMFNLTALHTLMHTGQFVAVRRQAEMPIAF